MIGIAAMGVLLTVGLIVQSSHEYRLLTLNMEKTERTKDQVETFMNEFQEELQKRSITKTAVYYSYDDDQWTIQVAEEGFLEEYKGEIQSVIDEVAKEMSMGKLAVHYRALERS